MRKLKRYATKVDKASSRSGRAGERWMFRVKGRVGGSSGGRQQEYTVKRGRGESMCMEECDIVQCGRWDRVIALAGVEEEDPERSTTTPAVPVSIWLEVVCTG